MTELWQPGEEPGNVFPVEDTDLARWRGLPPAWGPLALGRGIGGRAAPNPPQRLPLRLRRACP